MGDFHINPAVGFKIYNVAVVLVACVTLAWRTRQVSCLLLLWPLLVMADSDVSLFKEHWYLIGCRMRMWRAVFTSNLVYDILVSGILTTSCIVLHWKWGTRSI